MTRSIPSLMPIVTATTATAETFSADIWADNWFEMHIIGEQVAENSMLITTERSLNAESFIFKADRPFVIGLVAKEFKENDTRLEYIGVGRQQMGDGGVIVQIRDSAGELAAVSNEGWQCYVIHTAPLDKSCESEANPVAGERSYGFEAEDEPGRPAAGGVKNLVFTQNEDGSRSMDYGYQGQDYYIRYAPSGTKNCDDYTTSTVTNSGEVMEGEFCR